MPKPRDGFTLVELLMVVLVAGLLLAMAAPTFSALLERNRATAVFHRLTASLAGARLAAVHSGRPVALCPTRDGLRCRMDLAWDEGWMAYLDPGRQDQPASAGDIIQHTHLPGGALAVRSSVGRHRIRFQPSGWASGANLSLRVCSRSSARLLGAVVVNNAGRPRTERQDALRASCPFLP
jgi:type IV fimbrial biogenesis protein FimT